ncbi:hypothetical protein FQZ97_1088310 [compost metagenome]
MRYFNDIIFKELIGIRNIDVQHPDFLFRLFPLFINRSDHFGRFFLHGSREAGIVQSAGGHHSKSGRFFRHLSFAALGFNDHTCSAVPFNNQAGRRPGNIHQPLKILYVILFLFLGSGKVSGH